MELVESAIRVVLIGIGATVVMDVWSLILKALGSPTLNYAFVCRWLGHMPNGVFAHEGIGKAAPINGEATLGWVVHYVTGIVFAALLVGVTGWGWLEGPTLGPALGVGIATVLIPLFVMQPAFGLGVAATRTPKPLVNCLKSLLAHAVFGVGLYVSAVVLQWL